MENAITKICDASVIKRISPRETSSDSSNFFIPCKQEMKYDISDVTL